jgi:hypothetical protein
MRALGDAGSAIGIAADDPAGVVEHIPDEQVSVHSQTLPARSNRPFSLTPKRPKMCASVSPVARSASRS